MTAKIFIDGDVGTTGLQVRARLEGRRDLTLLRLSEVERKDPARRAGRLHEADLAILCLPDAAARESAGLVENPATRLIDASTAHRIDPGWDYGFAEMDRDQAATIAASKRVSNPGCYATGATRPTARTARVRSRITTGVVWTPIFCTVAALRTTFPSGRSLSLLPLAHSGTRSIPIGDFPGASRT